MSTPEANLVPLSDVAASTLNSFVDGPFGSEMKSDEYTDEGVRLIQLQNIGDGIWIDENKKFISAEKFATLKRHGAVPGDIAIAKMADPVARSCILPPVANQFIVVADCIKLTPDRSKYDAGFVSWAINSHNTRREAELKSSGTTRLRINLSALKTVHVWAPPLPEQSRIAAVLDTVDEAIEKTEAVIAKLKQVRAGLLHDLLTRGLDENGQLRDPIAHPEQFQDSPLGRIPREWKIGPFREFGTSDRPYLKTGPFGSSLKQEHWVPEGVPVATIGSLGEGEFITSEILHVSKETARVLAAYSLWPGDIVFSRVADVGRSVVVTEAERGWIMSSNMMWISVDQRKADPQYVQLNISSNAIVRRQIQGLVNSAGREVANAAVMNSLRLPWAPINEQKRILLVLHATDSHLHGEQVTVKKLYLLKSGVMNDLLTGRVRVPEGIAVTG